MRGSSISNAFNWSTLAYSTQTWSQLWNKLKQITIYLSWLDEHIIEMEECIVFPHFNCEATLLTLISVCWSIPSPYLTLVEFFVCWRFQLVCPRHVFGRVAKRFFVSRFPIFNSKISESCIWWILLYYEA